MAITSPLPDATILACPGPAIDKIDALVLRMGSNVMQSVEMDLTGAPWSHVAAALQAVAVYPHAQAICASVIIDRHLFMEASRLVRFLDLEDQVELCAVEARGNSPTSRRILNPRFGFTAPVRAREIQTRSSSTIF
jgi:hypothetical protein